MPHTLKICCWNIQGIQNQQLGNKLEDSEVKESLMKYDIICLLETHSEMDTNIELQGYNSTVVCRPKFGKARKPSGGIAVIAKNNVSSGVSFIKSNSLPHDMLWVKLSRNFTHRQKEIYIGVLYLSPANSSYIQRQDMDVFSLLENEVAKYAQLGDILLMGDFNARTACENDYINNDGDNAFVPLPDVYVPDLPMPSRRSHDMVVNTYGRKLLELCKCSSLRLLNGRKLGDSLGKFTCHEYGGSSTIDYMLTNPSLYEHIQYFKVNDWLGHFSDHCAIECGLDIEIAHVENVKCKITPRPCRYKWYEESPSIFKQTLLSGDIQEHVKSLSSNIMHKEMSVNEAVSQLNEILYKTGDRCLKKHKSGSKKTKKQKWFDFSCDTLRQQVKRASKKVSENPFNNTLKIDFYKRKKEYKKLLKWKKRRYKEQILDQLENLHSKNPKEYWKLVKELQNYVEPDSNKEDKIKPEAWYDYFQDLLGKKSVHGEKDANMERMISELAKNMSNAMDDKISFHEVNTVIKNLKNRKAVSMDIISNEIIKASFEVIPETYVILFNHIYDSGHYPSIWSSGLITTLHKKGSTVVPGNYRGITICSCLGKVYSAILNNRFYKFIKEHKILSEEQISSTKGAQTVDHMFVLKTIIDTCKKQKQNLFVCFLDLSKAFDSVWRNGLLYKLLKIGVGSKFFNSVKSMHDNVQCSVNTNMGLTPFFTTTQGVRQGDVLSPQLFNLFLNDIPSILDKDQGVKLNAKSINCLMYADDIAILSNSHEGLQQSVNKVREYFNEWELNVNVQKSAFMTFGPKTKSTQGTSLLYGNLPINRTEEYCYLGIQFSCNGLFTQAQRCLLDKARKACFKLKQIIMQSSIKPKNALFLFHSLITPICMYGSELWAPYSIDSGTSDKFFKDCENKLLAEKLFMNFSKFILGVNKKSVNLAVRGELGTYPLLLHTVKKLLKYNTRLKNFCDEHLMHNAYRACETLETNNMQKNWTTWFDNVRKMCMGDTSNNLAVKNCLMDLYKEYFRSRLQALSQGKLSLYAKLKQSHGAESYCSIIDNPNHRRSLCKIRISAHPLKIETGRYGNQRTERDLRICTFCNSQEVEDEEHFLIRCGRYVHQRESLLQKISHECKNFASLCHASQAFYLLNAEGDIIKWVARYCWECLELRNNPANV